MLGSDGGSSLAENSSFRRVASKIPGEVSSMSFSSTAREMRPVWDRARKGEMGKEMEEMLGLLGDEPVADIAKKLFGAIKFEKLPEFDAVRKYFPETGAYTIMNEGGLRVVIFTPKE